MDGGEKKERKERKQKGRAGLSFTLYKERGIFKSVAICDLGLRNGTISFFPFFSVYFFLPSQGGSQRALSKVANE
jgi:hypothetical protein